MATLLELRTQARQRADMVNSQFVSDSELNGYINGSAIELYDLFVRAYDDYFSTPVSFSITSGNTYSLPADFYKIRGLDLVESTGSYLTIMPYNFQERNRRGRTVDRLAGFQDRGYRAMGNLLYIEPSSQAPGSYRLWYIPRFTRLSADVDILAGIIDFEEYVIVDAAIKMKDKEESDVSVLMAQKNALVARVEQMVADRDAGAPERVADVSNYEDLFFPRG